MCSKELLYNYNMNISDKAWEIGEAFLQGILLEVSSYPKPGLVSSISMGSHKDMNILTFMTSSAAIAPAFYLCAQAGIEHTGDIKGLLPTLRKIGVVAEKRLLAATKGINTQRGILFAAGMMCGSAGYLEKKNDYLDSQELFQTAARLTEGLVERELSNINPEKGHLTAGEKLYLDYKATGIRGEVEAGFPSVQKKGLPAFQEAIQKGVSLNYCLVHTLLALMTCVEDTTILWRKDLNTLKEIQKKSQDILDKGSVFTENGLQAIYAFDKELIGINASPGGSADLVSVTVGTYLLENKQFPVKIL